MCPLWRTNWKPVCFENITRTTNSLWSSVCPQAHLERLAAVPGDGSPVASEEGGLLWRNCCLGWKRVAEVSQQNPAVSSQSRECVRGSARQVLASKMIAAKMLTGAVCHLRTGFNPRCSPRSARQAASAHILALNINSAGSFLPGQQNGWKIQSHWIICLLNNKNKRIVYIKWSK